MKLVRVEQSKAAAAAGRSHSGGRGVRSVVGSFRIDEPLPADLLDGLTREERRALACWLVVYREDQARARAMPVLAGAAQQFEVIVAALEAAADTLSMEDADQLWVQLQAVARTLKRAGHARPRTVRRPTSSAPGQRDFFCEADEFALPVDQ